MTTNIRPIMVVLLTLTVSSILAAQVPNIAYDKLSDCQRTRFETFPGTPRGVTTWGSALDDSQRIEYAGGTQALTKVAVHLPPCESLEELSIVRAIWGSRPNYPSADQFNIETLWLKTADKIFESAPHWTGHNALLHSGYYGYQENRNGNPFLGIVVLFNNDKPELGQFHVGFRSWFGHYQPDNGNVAANYKRYCEWYGTINGYPTPCDGDSVIDWPTISSNEQRRAVPKETLLKEITQEFLQEWYVDQNIDSLVEFVARDNAFVWLASAGALPKGVTLTEWYALFSRAFVNGPGTVRFSKLADAIQVANTNADSLFAVLSPNSAAGREYFPPDDFPEGRLDVSARFLRHLKREYFNENTSENRLNLVVFANSGPGLLPEGCVLFWIKEVGDWKLAAFQGTD